MPTHRQHMLQRYYIVRHGETEANASGRIQGSTDLSSRLTDRGRAQAAEAGAALGKLYPGCCKKINRVYRSPLTRAGETLSILREQAAPMIPPTEIVLPDLTGINLYSWEGRNQSALRVEDAAAYQAWIVGDAKSFEVSGRRPVSEVWERAKRVWSIIRTAVLADSEEEKKETSTLIVCHGTLSQALLCTAFGWDEAYFRRYDFSNCGMVEILWGPVDTMARCWRWIQPKPSEWMQPCHEEN